jgi:hypothetical protein
MDDGCTVVSEKLLFNLPIGIPFSDATNMMCDGAMGDGLIEIGDLSSRPPAIGITTTYSGSICQDTFSAIFRWLREQNH